MYYEPGRKLLSLGKIIAIIVAIPTFIIGAIVLMVGSWAEGLVIESLLQAFEVNPIIIALVSIVSILLLILGIIRLASEAF